MNRYKKLAFNSLIFAIGNFGSKLISLLLVPLYTYYLSTGQYGTVDLVTTTLSLLVPIFTLSVYDAVLRFVMDKKYNKIMVLNNALMLTALGYLLALMMYPLFQAIFPFEQYLIYFYIMLFTSSLNSSLMQFIRANNQVKLFALVGIISSVVVLICNIILITILHEGISGYLISLIMADLVSTLILFTAGEIHKYLSLSYVNIKLLKDMLVYSIPLVPNTLMWWIMGVSDRYIITFLVGVGANGLYAVANKIPSILSMINSIFIQAWQMSAIEEASSQSKSKFYSNVFNVLATAMFVSTSLIIMFLKLILKLIISVNFYEAWNYVPFLLLGIIFSSFSGFLGTNYIAAKNTIGVFRTSIIGAIINVGINFGLIPIIGTNGASISTMLSFFVIWLLRVAETRSFVTIHIHLKKFISNLVIILLQIFIVYLNLSIEIFLQFGLVLIIIMLNIKEIKMLVEKCYQMTIRKTSGDRH